MPPGRRSTRSREEFIEASIAYADEFGLEALTVRALGQTLGASPTAVYRYFRDKDALVVAMRETLLAAAFPAVPLPTDPAEALVQLGLGFRRAARAHPCLSQIMGMAAVDGPSSLASPRVAVEALEAAGLRGAELVRAYRQLESFVVGSSMFDFSGAPRHLLERYERLRRFDHPDFAEQLSTVDDIDRVNEDAYEATLRALVSALFASVPENASI